MELKKFGLPYVIIRKQKDFQRITPGDFVILTFDMADKYRKSIKKWLRIHQQNVFLAVDESDELTNPYSITTKTMLDCFRRCRMKMAATGTMTRNNIPECASQMELLYNNSMNMISECEKIYSRNRNDEKIIEKSNPYYGKPIPAYQKGYRLFTASHASEKITVFGLSRLTQDVYNADVLNKLLRKTVITRTLAEIMGRNLERLHQYPVVFAPDEKEVYHKALHDFTSMKDRYFTKYENTRKDSMMKLIQQIQLLLRISGAPDTVEEYTGCTPVKTMTVIEMAAQWENEIVAVGVRHKDVLDSYVKAFREHLPDRKLFRVTGSDTTFAMRRKLKKTLRDSGNGILLCTQQSLPSSVNFEYVNKIIIPELHYNNAKMSQFYRRFLRFDSKEYKDIYFVTIAGSLESNLMQMVVAKEKLNLFMKGIETDLNAVNEKFGVDYDLLSLIMVQKLDENGRIHIDWGEHLIA